MKCKEVSKSFDPWPIFQDAADLDQKLRFFYLFDKVENLDDLARRQGQKGKKASEKEVRKPCLSDTRI